MSVSSSISKEVSVHELLTAAELPSSTEDPPMSEWSSLASLSISESPKVVLYKQGLYDPGRGEICTDYIPMSASSILLHPYYNYPGVKDPGVLEALLEPEVLRRYSSNGQDLYLHECEQMNIIPMRSFWRGLLQHSIDLKYYGVDPRGVKAMCAALAYNNLVVRLDLTSNFLDDDACYHLGQMIGENAVLQELVLCGCRIQHSGVRRLVTMLSSRRINLLDLSRNEIGDNGFEYLAEQFAKGAVIKRLNLSYNDLGMDSALSFATAIEGNNTITHLDLSWNKLSSLKGTNELFAALGESKVLVELNVSWNGVKVSRSLVKLLSAPTMRVLDLSNNRLPSAAARFIARGLTIARRLNTLDLSYNPFTPEDALTVLRGLDKQTVKIVNLILDEIAVNKQFIEEQKLILSHSYRKKTKVVHGQVLYNYILKPADMRLIVMKRLDFLTKKAGKKKVQLDIALYFLEKIKTLEIMQPREVLRDLKLIGVTIDEDLVNHLAESFPGPMTDKGGYTIKLAAVVDMIQRLWPERKLPPTPPPKAEPEGKKKGNKGKKKK